MLIPFLKSIGAYSGILALAWNFCLLVRSYLALEISAENVSDELVIVKVSALNAAIFSKRIDYAALVATSEHVSIDSALQAVCADAEVKAKNPFFRLYLKKPQSAIYVQNTALIPLNELYKEQHRVGPSEKVTHACSINVSNIERGSVLIIRVIVYIFYFRILLRWRYTATAVLLGKKSL